MIFKALVALCFLAVFLGLPSLLEASPDWIDHPPKDGEFKYYIGRSGPFSNERDAVNAATRSAIEQAISQNFGITAQIQNESYESLSSTQLTTRIRELTDKVNLRGFEQNDFFRESNGKNVSVWILFRYPIAEIEKEKRRLSSESKDSKPTVQFSESGVKSSNQTVLEVITEPEGASVFIDGEAYGKSPLRIMGQLEPGQHRLRVEHPNFEINEEEIILPPEKTSRIDKTLIQASGKISIATNPSNALVLLNGKVIGNSPIEPTEFPAGEKLVLEISHSESERFVQEVTVEKGTLRPLSIDLPLKPSFISLSTEPSKATVVLDGVQLASPIQKKSIKAGPHRIRIAEEGYVPYDTSIEVRGGAHEIVPTIRLVSLSEEELRLREFPWIGSLDLGFGTSPLQGKGMLSSRFGGSLEKRFYGLIGLRGSIAYVHAADGGGFKESKKLQGWEFSAALPVFVYRSFFLGPEVGYFLGNYSENIYQTTLSGSKQQIGTQKSDFDSLFYGGIFGWEYYWANNWGISVEGRVRKNQESNGVKGEIQFLGSGSMRFRF